MASRTAFLLLASLAAVACLYFVAADEVVNNAGRMESVETSPDVERNSGFDMTEADAEVESTDVAEAESVEDDNSGHSLSRMLTERSSKRCWSKKHCKKHFKQPGCCKEKCVNLAWDNKNCGECGRYCNVEKGYHCRSGKCQKLKKQSRLSQCGKHKQCEHGLTCCKTGKCVNLETDRGHCGKCGKGCGPGEVCCKGKCMSVKHDPRNCGACGKQCGYGMKCCDGYCKSVFGNDKNHCGACGKKCDSKCRFGICGYGH